MADRPSQSRDPEQLLGVWKKRAKEAQADRRRYERQWLKSQNFVAGRQWLLYDDSRGGSRVIEVRKGPRGQILRTTNVLTQYVATAIGKMAADDYRPEFLTETDSESANQYAEQLNLAFGWGWDEEWNADRKLLQLIRILSVLGTGAIRARYDRNRGPIIGEVPHKDGRPILDPESAREHVFNMAQQGKQADLKTIREGCVAWDVFTPWNLLPPPGIDEPADFPFEAIMRPVSLDQLVSTYGAAAENLQPEELSSVDMMGSSQPWASSAPAQLSPSTVSGVLTDSALLYTGYQRSNDMWPDGYEITWAGDTLMAFTDRLPLTDWPRGPRSGLTYFRWQPLVRRFWGQAFVEPGLDAQEVRNKRVTQIDEIIDRGPPTVFVQEGSMRNQPQGLPAQVIEIAKGSAPPQISQGIPVGPWLVQDVAEQDSNIEKALGLRSVALGQAPAGVSAYSAMALLTENDATKLDPVANDFRLQVAELSRDSVEQMRNWPSDKQVQLAGEDGLQALVFNAQQQIPTSYVVKPARGSSLPRSQAAEIQKIADLWNAATVSGVVAQNPGVWLDWYRRSLDAGQPLELPETDSSQEQLEKAAVENTLMLQSGQPVPVDQMDDPHIHVPEHQEALVEANTRALLGDPSAQMQAQALQQHIQEHEQMAAQMAQMQQMQQMQAQGPPPQPGAPQDSQGSTPFDQSRAVRYENQVLAPHPPSVRF